MLMASMMHEHPTEFRADMQRYYGLNVSQCGKAFSPFHLSACAANLPLGSATLAAIDESLAYTLTERALLAYMGVDMGKKSDDNELPELEGVSKEEFWEWYSKPRKEVDDECKRW